ncbi:MAG TPA: RraA family protein [Acidobacteriota bacterium]|nr:RraA family protein [Acidobacteriota bacterium]
MRTIDDADEMVRRFAKFSTALLADAMGKHCCPRLKHQVMHPAIRPLSKRFRIAGRAFTVRCYPGATYAMELALQQAPRGSVIVCDGQGSDAGVLMGELMSICALRRGLVGAIIDGAVRDVESIVKMGFPVFSRHITPRSGTYDQLGEVQTTISCGSVVVSPSDIVVADADGVVVVPNEISEQVAGIAHRLWLWEENVKEGLLRGQTLEEAVESSADLLKGLTESPERA